MIKTHEFDPATSGVLVLLNGGVTKARVTVTDVIIDGSTIWYSLVRDIEIGRGHYRPRPTTRHRALTDRGWSWRFEPLDKHPSYEESFEDRYTTENTVSECD